MKTPAKFPENEPSPPIFEDKERRDWHRLMGLFLTEYFLNSPYQVEVEKDLSLKQQYLDIVIIRRTQTHDFASYPAGFDNLAEHNLVSYKSLHEPFDMYALWELLGHYVNYRKQESPTMNKLLPENQFRLYALCTRKPREIFADCNPKKLSPGVYELRRTPVPIRLIILAQIPQGDYNHIWRLFSAKRKNILDAQQNYRFKSTEYSSLMYQLFETYQQQENYPMPYTYQQFERDFVLNHLKTIPVEDRIKDLSVEDRVKDLSDDDLIKNLSPERLERLLQLGQKLKSH